MASNSSNECGPGKKAYPVRSRIKTDKAIANIINWIDNDDVELYSDFSEEEEDLSEIEEQADDEEDSREVIPPASPVPVEPDDSDHSDSNNKQIVDNPSKKRRETINKSKPEQSTSKILLQLLLLLLLLYQNEIATKTNHHQSMYGKKLLPIQTLVTTNFDLYLIRNLVFKQIWMNILHLLIVSRSCSMMMSKNN